jgi:uncharacterized protein YndB with AHSA1/START domain
MSGTFREVVPPARIVHTEIFDEDWTGGETTVTTTLAEDRGTTTLTVTVLYASKAARDAALETNFAAGMETGYDALATLLPSLGGEE